MGELALSSLSKRFGVTEVLRDINCTIADGEFIGIVGPSGCGKTTLLRLIAGLEEASSGTISIEGRVVNSLMPRDRNIAMVFQNYALYPHKTVYENLAYSLRLRRVAKNELDRRVRWAASLLQLDALLQRRPSQLSGGQRQRVAMGRAIVREPTLFLFDEPLRNLDANLRTQMRVELKRLHNQLGITSIYVTHDQTEAMTLADRLIVLKSGLIEQIDVPAKLYFEPSSRFVASFIGSPPMNFFNGTVDEDGRGFRLRSGEILEAPQWLQKHKGREAILGIRPEHLTVRANGQGFPLKVDIIEMLGADSYLYGRPDSNGGDIVCRVPTDIDVRRGDKVYLNASTTHMHFFDVATERRISKE